MIFIEEIVSQMRQGATKPLRCLDSNGIEYVVKFDGGMTFDELVKEWSISMVGQCVQTGELALC